MQASQLKPGHWLVGAGGALLLISMLFGWYGDSSRFGAVVTAGGARNAFDSPGPLGGLADLLIVAAALIAIAYWVASATGRELDLAMPASAITTLAGATATVLVLGRMIFQPGINEFVSLKFGIWFALLMSLAILAGGFLCMQEEGATFDTSRSAGRERHRPGEPPV